MVKNSGNATAYVAGQGHIPLPHADHQHTYRAAHQTQDPKPLSTFDWDWNKATCTGCGTKTLKAALVDGACPTCRGVEPVPAIRAQTAPLEHSRDGSQVYVPYDDDAIAERFQAPAVVPADPEPAPEPATVEPDPVAQIEPSSEVENRQPAEHQPLTSADLLNHQLDHTTRTLTRAHRSTDPVAGMLRTAALSAIAALDIYLELHHPAPPQAPVASTAGPADATGHTTQPAITGLGGTRPAAAPQGEGEQQPATSHTVDQIRARGGRPRIPATPQLIADVVRRYQVDQLSIVEAAAASGIGKMRARQILLDAGVTLHGRGVATRTNALRLIELGLTTRQVKEWAVDQGLLQTVARGAVASIVVNAYLDAHPQEGQPA